MVNPGFKTFTAYVLFIFNAEICWAEKKNIFYWQISPKNLIQAAVKVKNDGETLGIPYVWAQQGIFLMTVRQTKTFRRTGRKFLTNAVGQISNFRLVTRVLERKMENVR